MLKNDIEIARSAVCMHAPAWSFFVHQLGGVARTAAFMVHAKNFCSIEGAWVHACIRACAHVCTWNLTVICVGFSLTVFGEPCVFRHRSVVYVATRTHPKNMYNRRIRMHTWMYERGEVTTHTNTYMYEEQSSPHTSNNAQKPFICAHVCTDTHVKSTRTAWTHAHTTLKRNRKLDFSVTNGVCTHM